jgi:hypothetical protein
MAPPRKTVGRPGAVVQVRIEPAGQVLAEFLASRARAKFVQGPVGSGKTRTLIQSLQVNALMMQPPDRRGVRRRRTVVIRNTYKQLIDTVIPSIREAMPEDEWGAISISGRPRWMIRRPGLEWEWLFYAADKPEDVEDFKSLQCSDIWMSEFRYAPREIVGIAIERTGRFPAHSEEGCAFPQVMGETNAPTEDHWSAIMSGQQPIPAGLSEADRRMLVKPEGWEFHLQPPAVLEVFEGDRVVGYRENPAAENLANLRPGYYREALGGKTDEEIRTELLNRPGRLRKGKPVWPAFKRDVHVARSRLAPVPHVPITVGQDFGRTPASVFVQSVGARVLVLGEFWAENMGARAYARSLKGYMATAFPGAQFVLYGDPAGDNLAEADDISPMMMFRAEGLRVVKAPTNDPTVRTGAVDELLRRLDEGAPSFLVDPECRALIAAMDGGYQFARMQVAGERYAEVPLKDRHSHIADALQYAVVGLGYGRALLTSVGPQFARPGGGVVRRGAASAWRGQGWNRYARR